MNETQYGRRALLATLLLSGVAGCAPAWGKPGTYSAIAMHFELPDLPGNPFDFAENDIQVEMAGPRERHLTVPAYFDGGVTWGMRFTPPSSGKWTMRRVLRNGQPITPRNLAPAEFAVSGEPKAGFIRRAPDHPGHFSYENGAPYYPLGCNAAWNGSGVTVEQFLADMADTGQNWSRIWMCHWDGKSLDWLPGGDQPALGRLDLGVARRWDGIVEAAERGDIAFQMVLQHHGQYATDVNPNWADNPWNVKNGGFLATPEAFFTDPKVRQLTRAKYRYILARYGYSPHILAWELFNEVQFSDAGRKKQYAQIAAWHKDMAAFLREQDVHRHLITTSSDPAITGLYDAVDYRQPHAYPSDLVATVRSVGDEYAARASKKEGLMPIFLGEIGPETNDLANDDGRFLHQILWSSVASAAPGAAQYWAWDNVIRRKLIDRWRPATGFVKSFRLASRRAMRPAVLRFTNTSKKEGTLTFGPGGGWGKAAQTRFVVEPGGEVAGIGTTPSFLQGNAHRADFPYAEFATHFQQAGTFAVRLRQVSRGGAHVVVSVDGKPVAGRIFPAADSDVTTGAVLTAPIPAGAHTIRLENTGADWAVIEAITLSPYGSPLRAVAKADSESVVAWIYPATPIDGNDPLTTTVSVPGLDAGEYRVYWWDTGTGKTVRADAVTVADGKPLVIKSPPIATDIALFAAHERVESLPPV